MTTFSGEFLGCKVSQTDLEALRERLAADGFEEVEAGAAIHVVNGCCVTGEALAKTRQAVRRALARGADDVLVTGCAARLASAGLGELGARVHVIARPSEATPGAVGDALRALGCRGGAAHAAARSRVRAFVKVQDGCSFGCSFCVIPLVRGATRSRPLGAVLEEARRRVAAGHREIVLTGVNIGLYRDRAAAADLATVVDAVAATPGVERLRLSSIEVEHVVEPLLEVLAGRDNVLPHLHVPLQSGDDAVLRAMRRRYTSARYLQRIERARAAIRGLRVTADVLVGFPGEDEAAFARTLAVVRAAGIDGVHAFPYSPRPGTRTAGADPVPAPVKRRRSEELRALAGTAALARRRALLGTLDEVLVERVDDGVARGYGRDYTAWRLPFAADAGAIVRAIAEHADADGLRGRAA